ncbi:MAG: EF-P lysine aminoacylase GenX [Deltaproteobacteria bacterium RBG_16_44_11]|nr:MAG: EF-P lysine aminoacylase GenX [Deltaproteobacteria bacterium RBG_16_44_11]
MAYPAFIIGSLNLSTSHFDDNFYLARKSQALHLRAKLIQNIRHFFIDQDFLEVETPIRIPSPAPEEHIEAIPSGDWFLQTSPELCMKRLLAAGYPRIFQICKCFRAAERGNLHLPEFSMLEWYVAKFDYSQLMEQCETMLIAVFKEMGVSENISWSNREIDLTPPWERLTVAQSFVNYAPLSCQEALKQDKFDEIMVEYIEPQLGVNRPVFIYDYPSSLASLAKLKKSDPTVAQRFELYMFGVELANGFSELTDAKEQRERFEKASQTRSQKKWADYPQPQKFLEALKSMPEAAGIALGIDRLVMLLTNIIQIDDIVAFTPEIL